VVGLASGPVGHRLCWEQHDRDGSWQAWVSWVQESGSRAISNLVDNAAKYSDPGTRITVDVMATTVTVRDRGRGIPPGDLARVFDRFYRAVDPD
jgi:signal transduction histidine kinase